MAFTLTWADVVAIAPNLSSLTTTQQNAVLLDVDIQLSEDKIGSKYNLACKYLAAHLGTLVSRGSDGPSGPIQSEMVGSVSRSYAANFNLTGYDTTTYGQQFRNIMRQLQYRVGVVL